MTTLIDRYVSAAAQHVPEHERSDVVDELRASIEDAIDARTDHGDDRETAERAVLSDLGDPERLAAGLVGRPLHLIGPRLFLEYRRVLLTLLAVVTPIVAVANGVTSAATGRTAGEVVAGAIGTALTVALHLCFWVTLVFALVERTGTPAPSTAWSVDDLPETSERDVSLGDTIGSIAASAIVIIAVLWQRSWSWATDASGAAIPVLSPELWSFWLPFLLVVLVAEIGFFVVLQLVGRWSYPFAHANLVLQLLFAVPVVYLLATGQLINPAFVEAVGWPDAAASGSAATTITIVVVVVVAIATTVDGYRKARRSARRDALGSRPA